MFIYHLQETHLVDWHSRVHDHPDNHYELHYFLSGEGSFRNQNQKWNIQKGQLFLTLPREIHGIEPGRLDDPLTYYAILFELESGDLPLLPLDDEKVFRSFPVDTGVQYRLRFEDMKNRYNSPNPFFRQGAQFDLLSFLCGVLGRLRDDEREPSRPSDNHGSIKVEQAMDLFQKHIQKNIHLAEIAELLKISEEYLIKLFRRYIGITPMRYFQNLKLEASVSLLLNSTRSIKEIAWQLNFSSQYHFSRNFKEFTGVSPSEYRARYLNDNPTNYATRIVQDPPQRLD